MCQKLWPSGRRAGSSKCPAPLSISPSDPPLAGGARHVVPHWHCSAHVGAQVYHMWYKAEHCAVPQALHRTGPWCSGAYTDEKFSAPRLALSIVAGPGVVGRVRRCGARWNDHICLEPVGTQQALLQPGRGGGQEGCEGGWGQVRMRNLNKVSL